VTVKVSVKFHNSSSIYGITAHLLSFVKNSKCMHRRN